MKRHILSFFSLLFAVTITAQTLNVVTGNVTYAFPAAKVGDMTCTDATTLTIGGKVFAINDINKIYVDNSEVTDNEVTVIYDGSTASLTVAGNVAPYVTPSVRGAHVSIAQSNTADVDGNEITYTLSGTSSDGEFYMSGKYKCSIEIDGLSLTNKTPVYSGAALHVQNGKRVNVSLKKGTENTLTDCSSPSEDLAQKAALYVKGHAEFKGKGTLNVKGQYKHAIKAGEYITVKNCSLNVTGAVSDAVNCNQYFLMESGSISMSGVGDDGIQCDIDDASLFYTGTISRHLSQHTIGRQAFVIARIANHQMQAQLFQLTVGLFVPHTFKVWHNNALAMMGIGGKSEANTYTQQYDHQCHCCQMEQQIAAENLIKEVFSTHRSIHISFRFESKSTKKY